jgi:hypothetical protein
LGACAGVKAAVAYFEVVVLQLPLSQATADCLEVGDHSLIAAAL